MELHINKFAPFCQQNLLASQNEILNKIEKIPQKLIQYIEKFMDRTDLWPKSGRACLAVSSGADSMFLLNFFWLMKRKGRLKEVVILHVNHGTRAENIIEEKFLHDYAVLLEIPLLIKKLKLNPSGANFESLAREKRYQFFYENLYSDDLLYLGHHIDDSLEWSLLCGFKSGEIKGRLGIPLRRGPVARPLFCMGRDQIHFIMKKTALPFYEDKSNYNTRYERNYIRHIILPRIKKRFSSYLKHYVSQSNALAKKLNLSLFPQEDLCEVIAFNDGVMLRNTNGMGIFPEDLIKKYLFQFSKEKRGKIGEQLKKLRIAVMNQKWGPINFSGGVEVHIRPGRIYIGQNVIKSMRDIDLSITKVLKDAITAQIPLDLKLSKISKLTVNQKNLIPYQFSIHKQKLDQIHRSLKKTDPLFPLSTTFASENGLWFYYKSKIYNDEKLCKNESLFCTF